MMMFRAARMWLFRISTHDIEQLRRGRNIIIVSTGVFLSCLAIIPLLLFVPPLRPSIGVTFASALICAIPTLLARAGHISMAGTMLTLYSIIGSAFSLITLQTVIAPFYLILSLLAAVLFMRPGAVWAILVADICVLVGILSFPLQSYLNDPIRAGAVLYTSILLVIVGLLSYLSARAIYQQIYHAEQSIRKATHDRHALELANQNLEQHVADRIQKLNEALAHQQQQDQIIRESADVQQQLHEEILALPVPVLPIAPGILVAPLIGIIDQARADRIVPTLLAEMRQRRTKILLVDLTGMVMNNTNIAQILINIADTTRLLGAQTVLVGLSPQVAQTLVAFNIDFTVLMSASTLQDGLLLAGAVVQ